MNSTPFEGFIPGHIKRAFAKLGLDADVSRSLSFNEFLLYIYGQPRWALDAHWRPQVDFLPSDTSQVTLGMVQDLKSFFEKIGIDYDGAASNRSFGGRVTSEISGELANVIPQDIPPDAAANYGSFLATDSLHIINLLYGADVELYKQLEA